MVDESILRWWKTWPGFGGIGLPLGAVLVGWLLIIIMNLLLLLAEVERGVFSNLNDSRVFVDDGFHDDCCYYSNYYHCESAQTNNTLSRRIWFSTNVKLLNNYLRRICIFRLVNHSFSSVHLP